MIKKLHVITVISNPVRYKSRYALYREFERRMLENPLVELWTAEMAFSDRPHEVTSADNPRHLQVRSEHELWHKENLGNLMIQRLPDDGQPVALVDADVLFARPDWAEETLEQLKHHHVVQMFSESMDLDDKYGHATDGEKKKSLLHQYHKGVPVCVKGNPEGYGWKQGGHPGYAWAWRREALDHVGGLIDFSILGSADWQMACGLLGDINDSVMYPCSEGYRRKLEIWGERARGLRRNVGFVPGLLLHYWHGPKSKRGYEMRTQIFGTSQFDPETDLRRDWQGLLQLHDDGTDRHLNLRDDVRRYFRSRNEDHPA